jgi:protoporphyrinogen oxidase
MNKSKLVILGGGPAGLAAAYYAQKQNLDFILLEAAENTGGNCRTIWSGKFGFDTGAHRFHDKDPEITKEIKGLLGEELKLVQSPSSIFLNNKYIDFPLSPLDLLKKLGPEKFIYSSWEIFKTAFNGKSMSSDFESLALSTYGKFIAENFLINYSEKLWGLPANKLSKNVSGKRLKGLDIKTFLLEGLSGKYAKTRHLDGAFYYPEKGFGQIMEKLESHLPNDKVKKKSRVTGIKLEGDKIKSVTVNEDTVIEGSCFLNTLPLPLLLKMISVNIPDQIKENVNELQYRHLVLAVYFLDKPFFSDNASLYFPEKEIPFTRIYEPKNRSKCLAPEDKTCIVVEIPCQMEDEWWNIEDKKLKLKIEGILSGKGLVDPDKISGFMKFKIPFAYPVLDLHFEEKLNSVRSYLEQYENLYLSGRSGLFTYSHLHDQMNWGKEIVEKILAKEKQFS